MQFTEEQAAEVKKWVVKRLEDMYVFFLMLSCPKCYLPDRLFDLRSILRRF
jgi:hypothetical protein